MILKLRQLASSSEIEVEDIISASMSRDEAVAEELRQLSLKYGWKKVSEIDPSYRVVPLATWVEFSSLFITEGHEGMRNFEKHDLVKFIVAFLIEEKSKESVATLYILGKKNEFADGEFISNISGGINKILSFNQAPAIDISLEDSVRNLLHYYLSRELSDIERASVICATRGVGNSQSIELIQSLPLLTGVWKGTEGIVVKSIKKRIKKNA